MKSRVFASVLAILMGCLLISAPGAASAASQSYCVGTGCTGRNPQGLCDRDARTLRTTDVGGDGTLDIRVSDLCHAMWGRFNVYWRGSTMQSSGGVGGGITHANVTLNSTPYAPLSNIGSAYGWAGGVSYWTGMVDASRSACVYVERIYGDKPNAAASVTTPVSLGQSRGLCT